MEYKTLQLQVDQNKIATLKLNRPEVHNAMNLDLIREMKQVLSVLSKDNEIRGVILTGEGTSFCAGGDLNWMQQISQQDREQRISEATELSDMLNQLDRLNKIVIGRINGSAYGGGIGLIACCDFSFAVESAQFALTEVSLGLIPATISPFVIRRIGVPNSRRLMLNAHRFHAAEGVRLGLLSEVVSDACIDETIQKEIKKLLKCAPAAVSATKSLISGIAEPISDEVRAFSIEKLAAAWETESSKEGISAFFNKRKPKWFSV